MCIDLTKRSTLTNVEEIYLKDLKHISQPWIGLKVLIVGTKSDLFEEREVSYEQGQSLADSCNGVYFETSSKHVDNFKIVLTMILKEAISETLIGSQQEEG